MIYNTLMSGGYGGSPWEWFFRNGMTQPGPSMNAGTTPIVTTPGSPTGTNPYTPPTVPPYRPPDVPPGGGDPQPPTVGPYVREGDPYSRWPGQPPTLGAPPWQGRSPQGLTLGPSSGKGFTPLNKTIDSVYGKLGAPFGHQGGPWKQFLQPGSVFGSGIV